MNKQNNKEIARLTKEVSLKEKIAGDNMAKYNDIKGKSDSKIGEIGKELAQYSDIKEKNKKQVDSLTQEIEKFKNQQEQIKNDYNKLVNKNRDLRASLAGLESRNASLDQEIVNNNNNMLDAQKAYSNLKAETSDQIEKLNNEIAQLNLNIKDIKDQEKSSVEEVQDYKERVLKYQKQIIDYSKKTEDLNNKIKMLEKETNLSEHVSSDKPKVVSLTFLLDNLKNGTYEEKCDSVIMLGDIGDKRAEHAIMNILDSPESDTWLKQLAEDALKQIKKLNNDKKEAA